MPPLQTALSTALLSVLLLAPAGAAPAVDLIPHHAFYELHLDTSHGQPAGIVEANGGMAIEVRETCDGWITNQRLLLRVVHDEDEAVETDNSFTSWESKDGLRYRFSVRDKVNGEVNEELRGEAKLKPNGGAGEATFSQPAKRTIALPKGALFPTAHVARILEAARDGTHLIDRVVFDGTAAEGPDEISAVIGKPLPLEKLRGLEKKAGQQTWPMRWAFFPYHDQSSTPDYELTVRMLEDGVVVAVSLIYDDFQVSGKVDYFEPLPKPKC